jgi:hypothetical protein
MFRRNVLTPSLRSNFLVFLTVWPYIWRHYVPPKRFWASTKLHGVTSQKLVHFEIITSYSITEQLTLYRKRKAFPCFAQPVFLLTSTPSCLNHWRRCKYCRAKNNRLKLSGIFTGLELRCHASLGGKTHCVRRRCKGFYGRILLKNWQM